MTNLSDLFPAQIQADQWTLDSFTDANGTLIAAHTPLADPSGNGWVSELKTNADLQINTNELVAVHSGTPAYPAAICTIDSGFSDGEIQVDLRISTTNFNSGVILRATDIDNMWMVMVDDSLNKFIIKDFIAGTGTDRAFSTPTISAGVWYRITVQFSGNTITAQINGGDEVTWASASAGATRTKHGIQLRTNNDRARGFYMRATT